MDRNQFLRKVSSLRSQGKSIRAIAAEIGVNRGRVDRALKALAGLADKETQTHLCGSPKAKGNPPFDAPMNALLVDLGRAQAATHKLYQLRLNTA